MTKSLPAIFLALFVCAAPSTAADWETVSVPSEQDFSGFAWYRTWLKPHATFFSKHERDLFGEERKPVDRKKARRAVFISDFRDLKPGDHVVHTDHGVARYSGLGRPKGGSLNRDFMSLAFAGGDRLFVPIDRLDLVQKFHGSGDEKPKLDKLGGPGWERMKARVRNSVRSMAKELLQLYASRHTARGRAFGPDTPWQREFEDAFPFLLTRDQERVLVEIKTDLENVKPMDRLLVGDVGFGTQIR